MKGKRTQYNLREEVAPLLEKVAARIRKKFKGQDLAREKILRLSREIIRFSSYAIRSIHRRQFEEAVENLSKAQETEAKLKSMLKDFPDMFYNLAYDAQKEYAEARLTLALTTDGKIPSPEDLGVGHAAFLNGMGERQWGRCAVIFWITFAGETWRLAKTYSRPWTIFMESWLQWTFLMPLRAGSGGRLI